MDLEDAIAQAYRSTLTASTSAKASERQRRVEAGHP